MFPDPRRRQQERHVRTPPRKQNAIHHQDGLAEWSKALASGASPQGRGFEPHSHQLDDGNLGGGCSFGHLRGDVMPKRM